MTATIQEASKVPLAYKQIGSTITHLIGSFPCNYRREIKHARALGLVQGRYTAGWQRVLRKVAELRPEIQTVVVADPNATKPPLYLLFTHERACLVIETTPSPDDKADDAEILEAAAQVISACTGDDLSAAVTQLKASVALKMLIS